MGVQDKGQYYFLPELEKGAKRGITTTLGFMTVYA